MILLLTACNIPELRQETRKPDWGVLTRETVTQDIQRVSFQNSKIGDQLIYQVMDDSQCLIA